MANEPDVTFGIPDGEDGQVRLGINWRIVAVIAGLFIVAVLAVLIFFWVKKAKQEGRSLNPFARSDEGHIRLGESNIMDGIPL